jgi:hypothetical protein
VRLLPVRADHAFAAYLKSNPVVAAAAHPISMMQRIDYFITYHNILQALLTHLLGCPGRRPFVDGRLWLGIDVAFGFVGQRP